MIHRHRIVHFVFLMSCVALPLSSVSGCVPSANDPSGDEVTPAEGSEASKLGAAPNADFCSGASLYAYGAKASLPACEVNSSFNNLTCGNFATGFCKNLGGVQSMNWTCFVSGNSVEVDCFYSCKSLCGGT
jgi:hypothetical protein